MTELVTIDEVRAAAARIASTAVRTPLIGSPWPGLMLKPEVLQPIGAFKIRGATNAIAALDPAVRARGVVAHSSGNHAQAVAFAARTFGVAAHIVIPDNAPRRKIDATEALGATVELVPIAERATRAEEIAARTGMTLIPPFNHRDVIAGQGTIGLEIAEDLASWHGAAGVNAGVNGAAGINAGGTGAAPEPVRTVLVPVSGGGLISGIAAALAAAAPEVAVIGVEPELAGDAAESFHSGRRVEWPPEKTGRTCADGLRMFAVGPLPWEHIRSLVRDIVTVTEAEILSATRAMALDARIVAEPSGAAAVAAHLFHGDALPAGGRIAVVSGGNIDPALLASLVTEPAPTEPDRVGRARQTL